MKRRKFLTTSLVSTALFAQATTRSSTSKAFVVKNGEARFGIHTPYKGINVNDIKISGKDTDGQLAVFEYIGNEKAGPSLHVHHEQDEIFTVVEGEFLFQVGDEKFTAKVGDTVFAPRKVPHTWLQLSEKSKLIYYVQPAGKIEDFFLTMNDLKSPPTFDQAQKIHEAHGMTITGPGLSAK